MNYQQTLRDIYLIKVYLFTPSKWRAVLIKKREYGYETGRARRRFGVFRE